ncbi:N-acylneuraminate cytidylyltransferase [Halomicronema hongdechloris C2206]|uniref:N-acylneuraminate cytidylyltransferase n=1 Tax=Halomicronema hongdechloris C2206 TaxID=1641165 RepID=A0A1Z3HSJ7_9CYAN|nr:GDSL-type esterase/lipase family protein [Halomicronema hongdechloris]ASC73279.1 N-acylneuraminate cytidylyltransferase [Halomicronema hongdechloris C2206]
MADMSWLVAHLIATASQAEGTPGPETPTPDVSQPQARDAWARVPGIRAIAPPTMPDSPLLLPEDSCQVPQSKAKTPCAVPPDPRPHPQDSLEATRSTLEVPPPTMPFPEHTTPTVLDAAPETARLAPPRTVSPSPRPQTGSQLYRQRLAALRAGQLYTRIAPSQFASQWQQAGQSPSQRQWLALLQQEARAVAAGQGQNRLTVVVGDSLSLWLPSEHLPRDRFWLNQSISGETTADILNRLDTFAQTRPDTIHLMAGINDLKNGVPVNRVARNLRQIVRQLQQQHPQARIVLHSILPTRWDHIPSQQVQRLNRDIAWIARQEEIQFLNVATDFADAQGRLRPELTTDGLHLNVQGYRLWQTAILSI